MKTKTARFAAVVEECGRPEAVTLWQKKDARFTKLLRQNRVMTVLQKGGGKTDVGFVGFPEKRPGLYLAFPKSLKRYEKCRIVGIKWELVN